jgi:DNA-binding response OmpR family regulator
MRRTSPSGEPVIKISELVVDLQKRSVSVAGQPVHLAPHQYELLRCLR